MAIRSNWRQPSKAQYRTWMQGCPLPSARGTKNWRALCFLRVWPCWDCWRHGFQRNARCRLIPQYCSARSELALMLACDITQKLLYYVLRVALWIQIEVTRAMTHEITL